MPRGLGRGRRRHTLNAEVNIINLVDVVLVLLIIFMIAAPMMQNGIDVNLPKANARPVTLTTSDLEVAVLPGGDVRVGGERMTAARFREQLPLLVAARDIKKIFLRGDGAVTLNQLAPIQSAITQTGLPSAQIFDPETR